MRCMIPESHKSMISHVLERVIQSIKVSIESLKKNKQNSRSFPILDLSGTKIRQTRCERYHRRFSAKDNGRYE